MPRQQIVFSANTMDFWRNSINGLASNINFGLANTFDITGIITLTGSGLVLNVVNGSYRGNGSLIFALNALSMFGAANNDKLQNTSLNVMTTAGISGGANGIPLGSSITLTVSVSDSITNTRTDIPTSANSIAWAMSKANVDTTNASLITIAVDEARGGTGETTYSQGQLLIGNTISGKLDKSTITSGAGILTLTGNGSINVSLNLIQGEGILLSSSGNSGITISANGYPAGNSTHPGLIQLYDQADSTSTANAVTANAVNAMQLLLLSTPATVNVNGRLIDVKFYTTSNTRTSTTPAANAGTRYVWTKPNGASFIEVTLLAGGASGIGGFSGLGAPGTAGCMIYGVYNAAAFGATADLFVGGGGVKYQGANTWFVSPATLRAEESDYGASLVVSEIFGAFSNNAKQIQASDGGSQGTVGFTQVWDKEFNQLADPGELSIFMMTLGANTLGWAMGGKGGSTPWGRGGDGGIIYSNSETANGQDGMGYGSGGGAPVQGPTSTVTGAAGNGAPGFALIRTYSNS